MSDYEPRTTLSAVPNSFSRKQLKVIFHMVNLDNSRETLTLDVGHRIKAHISKMGMKSGAQLELTIEGIQQFYMDRLSHIQDNNVDDNNATLRDPSKTTVTVLAGEEGKQTFISVFYGVITEAFASFSGGSSTFKVKASTINLLAKTLSPPYSRRGSVLVSSLLADICKRAGIILVDHGGWKNRTLTNHYGEGTALTQISKIIAAVKSTFNYIPFPLTENDKGISPIGELHIWGPHYNEERDDEEQIKNDQNIPIISSATGMIGYPEYSPSGINFFTLFRPDLSFYKPVYIDSAYIPGAWQLVKGAKTNQDGQKIQAANKNFDGLWLPKRIDYYLTSEVADPVAFKPDGPDGGNWFTYVECQRSDVSPAYVPKDKPKDDKDKKK